MLDNFEEFSGFSNFFALFEKFFPNRTRKELKLRIKELKLSKGREIALKMIQKSHKSINNKVRQTPKPVKQRASNSSSRNNNNMFNVIIELSDECRNDDHKKKIGKHFLQ